MLLKTIGLEVVFLPVVHTGRQSKWMFSTQPELEIAIIGDTFEIIGRNELGNANLRRILMIRTEKCIF